MTTTIKALLKGALFMGAVCLLPKVALADGRSADGDDQAVYEEESQTTPVDNQPTRVESPTTQVEVQTTAPEGGATYIPDHAQAQARGALNNAPLGVVATTRLVPDHNEAQARGAGDDNTGLSAALPMERFPGTIPDHAEAEQEIEEPAR